ESERHAHCARAVVGLVRRMDAVSEIGGGDHRGLRVAGDLEVRLSVRAVARNRGGQRSKLAPVLRYVVVVIPRGPAAAGLLNVEEREVALAPLLAPAANERAHERVLIHA